MVGFDSGGRRVIWSFRCCSFTFRWPYDCFWISHIVFLYCIVSGWQIHFQSTVLSVWGRCLYCQSITYSVWWCCLYCQSTILVCLKSHIDCCCLRALLVLSKYYLSCLRMLLVLSKYYLDVLQKLHQPLLLSVSKYAVKAPKILRESLIKVPTLWGSLQLYCPSTNTYWGSHINCFANARCSSNCTVRVPTITEGVTWMNSHCRCLQICCQSTNILLRELYLLSWLVSKSASWGCFTCLLSLFPSTFTWGRFTFLLSNLLALLLVFCHTSVFI